MKAVVSQPTGMAGEFMKFLTKTNAIALAIGVIIGGAATKLVNGVVDFLISPILGRILGGLDLKNSLKINLGQVPDPANAGQFLTNYLQIGAFINSVIEFAVVMLVVFIIIKLVAKDMLADKA